MTGEKICYVPCPVSSDTILEAMASGLPAVVTRVGGSAESALEARTAFLVLRADSHALAHAIFRDLEAPELRKSHGRLARERVKREFSLERIDQQYLDVYDPALRKKRMDEPRGRGRELAEEPTIDDGGPHSNSSSVLGEVRGCCLQVTMGLRWCDFPSLISVV